MLDTPGVSVNIESCFYVMQYRMHPDICEFPSRHFYGNQLQNGLTMEVSRKAAFHGDKYLGPYVVFDVVDGHERVKHGSSTQSLCNEAEVNAALDIFKNLKARYVKNLICHILDHFKYYNEQSYETNLLFFVAHHYLQKK